MPEQVNEATAAERMAAKLEALYAGMPADEQAALLALVQQASAASEVTGFAETVHLFNVPVLGMSVGLPVRGAGEQPPSFTGGVFVARQA